MSLTPEDLQRLLSRLKEAQGQTMQPRVLLHPSWKMCYECGCGLDETEPYRYMDVLHEKDNPNTMRVYANEQCIVGSPNEAHWQNAIRVQPEEKR